MTPPLTPTERERLVEALRYDRCEYGCALTYTEESVKYDLAPAVDTIATARAEAAVEAAIEAFRAQVVAAIEAEAEALSDEDVFNDHAGTYLDAARIVANHKAL